MCLRRRSPSTETRRGEFRRGRRLSPRRATTIRHDENSMSHVLRSSMALLARARYYYQLSLVIGKTHFVINLKCRFKSWSVMFFGSDDFSLATLEELNKNLESGAVHKLEVVVTGTYNNPVFDYSRRKGLKIHDWPPTLAEHFDVGIVSSFGKLIPKHIIDYFPLGILNVHASLLPRYRGPMPIFHAIKNGDETTGISIMAIKPYKFDVGDVIMQKTCDIGSNEVFPSVKNKLAVLGAKCISVTLNSLPNCLEGRRPQDSATATKAPKITRDESVIRWRETSASDLYNRFRGLYGIYDLGTTWSAKSIKLVCISRESRTVEFSAPIRGQKLPGRLEYCRRSKALRVHCTDEPIYICSLRINNKLMTGFDFYRGYLQFKSTDEWFFE